MHRAYSVLEIKAFNVERREIEGFASTPEPDRHGDIMEPTGAMFDPDIPLLLHHDQKLPIGRAKLFPPTADGIRFLAHIPEVTTPGVLKDRVDEAWDSVKAKLLRGTSIGWKPIKGGSETTKDGRIRRKLYEILELSLVTIPANKFATITAIKSVCAESHAATGDGDSAHPQPHAGVTAPEVKTARKGARTMKISEQIVALETQREQAAQKMVAIQQKASDEGRTKDESERQEFDACKATLATLDLELKDLRDLEELNKKSAVPVQGVNTKSASESRAGIVTVTPNVPKGTGFVRYAMALAATRGNRMEAAHYAKRWDSSTPEVALVLKAASDAGTTTDSTWAAPLVAYQNLASEFVDLLRPMTFLGRIQGFRRVPFNVTIPRATSGSTVGWRGQGKPKPVGEMAFDQLSLGMAKAAGIVVIAEELARSSNPSAEAVISQDLREAIAQFLDEQFIDPSVAEVSNVSPAAVTNGASVIDSTGTTAAALRADFASALAVWTAADMSIAGGVILMTETQAIRLGMVMNSLGQREFPDLSAAGGTLFGLPVITSENIPAEGGSPAGNRIVLLKPSEVLLADDGGIQIDVSREASVQMNTTPDDPASASTVFRSFWQDNLVGIRAERFINWKKRRTHAAVIIEGAVYTGA